MSKPLSRAKGGDSGLFQASIRHRPRACHSTSSGTGLIQADGVLACARAPCGYARSGRFIPFHLLRRHTRLRCGCGRRDSAAGVTAVCRPESYAVVPYVSENAPPVPRADGD
jgi:hypothetical protein